MAEDEAQSMIQGSPAGEQPINNDDVPIHVQRFQEISGEVGTQHRHIPEEET